MELMFRASQSPKMGPGGWLDCKRVPPFQLMRSVVVPTTFLFGLPGAPGAGRWEPLNCERAEPGLPSQCQGRPHSALSLCLLASTSQTRTQQTNQPPRAELRAIDFPTPFPNSVSVSPTKHHQNPRAPEPPSPRAPEPPSYPSRLPPCCATVSAAPRGSIPPPSILRLSLPPTRVARQLIPRSSQHCSTASGPDGYRS